jgi:signal transduction histidine kinase
MVNGLAGALTDQQQQFLGVIKRNLERMNVLVSDLSDINRVESGRMQFEYKWFDAREVVADVVDSMQARLATRGQTLAVTEDGEGETAVYADPRRVNQVLTNLVSNAHKYTPDEGHIDIWLRPSESFVEIGVRDNGIGISAENQARLFTQFFRAEDEAVREQTGWGLGLSIVKMMVEAQGGEIWFESSFGVGSTFAFTVPSANIMVEGK